MRNRNALMVVAALSLSLLAAGCQSPSATTKPAALSPACHRAVMCDKCQTTWTPSYEFNNKGMLLYTLKPEMVCAECTKAAREYFETGKLPPSTCPTCGGHMHICKVVESKAASGQ